MAQPSHYAGYFVIKAFTQTNLFGFVLLLVLTIVAALVPLALVWRQRTLLKLMQWTMRPTVSNAAPRYSNTSTADWPYVSKLQYQNKFLQHTKLSLKFGF